MKKGKKKKLAPSIPQKSVANFIAASGDDICVLTELSKQKDTSEQLGHFVAISKASHDKFLGALYQVCKELPFKIKTKTVFIVERKT